MAIRITYGASVSQRFWEKVSKTPTCWLWTGGTTVYGYGVLFVAGQTPVDGAHRVSWRLHRGEIPKGLCVLHRCDVPACVNPDHLFLGTKGDNARDCVQKGRARWSHRTSRDPNLNRYWESVRKLKAART